MFSKWIESAKEKATSLISAGKIVLEEVCSFCRILSLVDEHDSGEDGSAYHCGESTSLVNDTANAFIRDNIRPPEDMTFITPNLVGRKAAFS